MDRAESLSHSKGECNYHVVFIPKQRRKTLYRALRKHLGEVFHRLAGQKESRIEGGHLLVDHVHMLIAIPPQYAVSQVIGYIKGKSAIYLAWVYGERKRKFVGQHFWARGLFRADGWSRRGSDSRLHSAAGGRGRPTGPDESPEGLISHLQVAPVQPLLSGPHTKAPGFAGGYLLPGTGRYSVVRSP